MRLAGVGFCWTGVNTRGRALRFASAHLSGPMPSAQGRGSLEELDETGKDVYVLLVGVIDYCDLGFRGVGT